MHKYNEHYECLISEGYKFIPNESLLGLLDLYKSNFQGDLQVISYLEIGCGLGIHVNSKDSDWEVEGLELSKSAADHLCKATGCHIYHCDFLEFKPSKSWDLILDSHLLHCTIGIESFKEFFKNVFNILKHGGSFLLEVMCESKEMSFEDNQFFDDETHILYQDNYAFRTILPSRIVEELIIESGLKIVYLRVDEIIKFIPNSHRSESRPTDPDRMRVICLKE